jgi:D-ribose pyranase
MTRSGLLNDRLIKTVAMLGHKETLVVCDAGLPIPGDTERIDLSVECGMPPFLDVVRAVLGELAVESAMIATETAKKSPEIDRKLREVLGEVRVDTIRHDKLKELASNAKAVVRTGECTPYSNVVLVAGVTF